MNCQVEGCQDKHYAKGYCRYHYKWYVEGGHGDPNTHCVMCGTQLTNRRGTKYCSLSCRSKWYRRYGCYAKDKDVQPVITEHRTGTYREAFKRKSPLACSVEGCDQPAHARGFCGAHYLTNCRYGTTVSPFGYAERKKHPLYNIWRWQARVKEGRVKAWNDFWQFVADVGEKPPMHMAARHSSLTPWGPDNFYWKEHGERSPHRNGLVAQWRERNPLKAKDHYLFHNYRIRLDEYLRMYEAQGGKCAICGQPGKSYDKANGRTETLMVDHCHDSNAVRELLCAQCNAGIGCFKDSLELLQKAGLYLKKHAAKTDL